MFASSSHDSDIDFSGMMSLEVPDEGCQAASPKNIPKISALPDEKPEEVSPNKPHQDMLPTKELDVMKKQTAPAPLLTGFRVFQNCQDV